MQAPFRSSSESLEYSAICLLLREAREQWNPNIPSRRSAYCGEAPDEHAEKACGPIEGCTSSLIE
jgi:hypothetical protein